MSPRPVEYEVHMLTPNPAGPGLKWRTVAVRPTGAEAAGLMEDFMESMADSGISRALVHRWAYSHLRAVEVTVTRDLGKSFHVGPEH